MLADSAPGGDRAWKCWQRWSHSAPGAKPGLGVAVLAMTALPFTVTGANLAIPEIREDFGSSLATLSWTLSAYSIVIASFTLLGGTLSSRFGYRRMFIGGVLSVHPRLACCACSRRAPPC